MADDERRHRDEAQRCARRARREARHRLAGRLDARHRPGALRDPALRPRAATITLAATDMELSLRTTLDAQVEGDGAVVIPGQAARRAGAAAARERRHDRVPAARRARCRSSRARTTRGCTSSTPRTSRGCRRSTRSCTRSTARRCSRPSTGSPRSASRDESRPVLTGILVRFEAGKLVMVATDSYRLSVKETRARRGGARARGDHPGARAHRAVAARAAATRSSSACTRTTSSSGPATPG